MSDTVYCYYCGVRHPVSEVRQIILKTGKRWRCIRSIEAAKVSRHEREAFGMRMTELNRMKAEQQKSKCLPKFMSDGLL